MKKKQNKPRIEYSSALIIFSTEKKHRRREKIKFISISNEFDTFHTEKFTVDEIFLKNGI